MEGKFTKGEKILQGIAFAVIVLATVARGIMGVKDTGVLVITVFMAVLLFVIFFVAALFPADWRMTEKQKAQIADKEKYQAKYRKVLTYINFLFAVFFGVIILITG